MSIKFVSFMPGVVATIGTNDIATISGYHHEKHAKSIRVERTAQGVSLHILTGPNRGDTIEMPWHAIASIRSSADAPAAEKKAAK